VLMGGADRLIAESQVSKTGPLSALKPMRDGVYFLPVSSLWSLPLRKNRRRVSIEEAGFSTIAGVVGEILRGAGEDAAFKTLEGFPPPLSLAVVRIVMRVSPRNREVT